MKVKREMVSNMRVHSFTYLLWGLNTGGSRAVVCGRFCTTATQRTQLRTPLRSGALKHASYHSGDQGAQKYTTTQKHTEARINTPHISTPWCT